MCPQNSDKVTYFFFLSAQELVDKADGYPVNAASLVEFGGELLAVDGDDGPLAVTNARSLVKNDVIVIIVCLISFILGNKETTAAPESNPAGDGNGGVIVSLADAEEGGEGGTMLQQMMQSRTLMGTGSTRGVHGTHVIMHLSPPWRCCCL